jgi:hypothetical protein
LKKAQKDGAIIVCEGELDAIICNQYNFRAVTRTNSARSWKAEWNKLFKGMTSTSATTATQRAGC